MVFDSEPSIGTAQLEKVACDLDRWTNDLQNLIVSSAYLDLVMSSYLLSFIKIRPRIPEVGDKILQKWLFDLAVTLTFDILTSNFNQFISVPKCT